jgi:Ni/Co efflux regulator RcnB
LEITMKKLVIAALAATTALTGVMSAGVAAAQPDHDRGHHDGGRDHDGGPGYRGGGGGHRDWNRQYSHDRWSHGAPRYYGGHYGYTGYRGQWRTGQRYPYWRDSRYVISDYRAYRLPPPRPGYRYYRDDRGDIVMAAIASGAIGLIIGSALN